MRRSLIIAILSVLTFGGLYAQTRSTEIGTLNDGKRYYIHTVQTQETLYGLSHLYNVLIDDIKKSNDNLESLNVGQRIMIPIIDDVAKETEPLEYKDGQIVIKDGVTYIIHFVKQGQTIYSISRLYQVTPQQILDKNPSLATNPTLSLNQELLIPFDSEEQAKISMQNATTSFDNEKETRKEASNSDIAKQSTPAISTNVANGTLARPSINVALLLPFFLSKNAPQNDDGIINMSKEIYTHTYQFLEYYEGALIALDSLKKLGISVNLDVIESNNDSLSINVGKIKTKTDLIIGPVFQKTFPTVANFAKRNAIPIVYPLSQEETSSLNPFMIQMNTPQKYRYKAMVDYIIQNNENCHVCIVYNSESLEKKSMLQCKAAFDEAKHLMLPKQITYETIFSPLANGMAILDRAMDKKPKTIIIVLSKQQAFANNFVTKIYQASKSHNIELWGMPQWELYENLELDFLFDLNLKLVTVDEIDYTSPSINSFISTYREKYSTEPTKFSFQGYDQMLYFGQLCAQNANMLTALRTNEGVDGLIERFYFQQKDNAAFLNTATNIVEYDKNTYTRKVYPVAQKKDLHNGVK